MSTSLAQTTSGAGVWCPACGLACAELAPGPGGRPTAACPYCGSLERHRLLELIASVVGRPYRGGQVLEVAPSPFTTTLLERMEPARLVSIDFDPAADGRSVGVQASLTALPFAAASFDFVLCYHVFEHIPDDRAAMRELARVLRLDGLTLVQVPWRGDRDTDEEPQPLTVGERVRRFGQSDHVRAYGRETLDERLRDAGLEVLRFRVGDFVGSRVVAAVGLNPEEVLWVARPARERTGPSLAELVPTWFAEALGPAGDRVPDLLGPLVVASGRAARADALETELTAVRAEVDGLRGHLDRLGSEREAGAQRFEGLAAQLAVSRDRAVLLERLLAETTTRALLEQRLAAREVQLWRRRYEALRGRLPIRVAARLARPLRGVTGRP